MLKIFKLRYNNSGYLQIDLAFGLFIFIILFIFVYNFYAHYKADLGVDNQILELQSDAQDICFLLSKSSGLPQNWETDINNTIFFGFKNINDSKLNLVKINQFRNDTYFTIIDKMNISANLAIRIEGISTNTHYLSFGVLATEINPKYANYQCYSNYNSEIVKIFVEVWK